MNSLKKNNVDIIIFRLTVLDLIEEILKFKSTIVSLNVHIVVITNFISDFLQALLITIKVDYYLVYPNDRVYLPIYLKKLEKYIMMKAIDIDKRSEIEIRVDNILQELCIPIKYSGFDYLKVCILLYYNDSKKYVKNSKALYAYAAEYCNSTPVAVEKGIRTAIKRSLKDVNPGIFYEYFHYDFTSELHPTPLDFVCHVVSNITKAEWEFKQLRFDK